jgi:hypothetical protein
MYASVEMLLKFYAENFFSDCTGRKSRAKSSTAQTRGFGKAEISHWLSRHFTRTLLADSIQFALVDFRL